MFYYLWNVTYEDGQFHLLHEEIEEAEKEEKEEEPTGSFTSYLIRHLCKTLFVHSDSL
jgi:hypothetical protein